MPKRATGVHKRSGSNVFQWRIKPPKDLNHLYPGQQWAHRCTLGTSDLREANRKATRLYADWQDTFALQRRGSTKIDQLTPAHGKAFAHEALTTLLADETVRIDRAKRSGWILALEAMGVIGMMRPAQRLGIDFDVDTPGAQEAFAHFMETVRAPIQAKLAEVPPQPPKPIQARKLRDVFNEWKRLKGHTVTIDTIRARERALALFEEGAGDPPIDDITRAQGHEFSAWLLTLGGAKKTASDRLKYVCSLLKFASRELEWIPRHPWDGIEIAYGTQKSRKPWSTEQISAFFALPLFTSYTLPAAARAGLDAAYWVPLLGLFTGARLGELVQLTVADVVEVEGIWCIDINEQQGKHLKTGSSIRQVPIHSTLIRLGLLEYVNDVRNAGYARLWPSLVLNREKPSHGFSLWFNQSLLRQMRDQNGNPVPMPDFHSLRHLVRSTMGHANIPEADQDLITGHASTGSTGTRVYRHGSLRKLQVAIEAIAYPTFTLARSYATKKLGVTNKNNRSKA